MALFDQCCALVLAIEFPVPEGAMPAIPNAYFDRSLAAPLANQLAFELGKHLPSLEHLGLVWMAACYDQAQILRPGWPVHQALVELYHAGTATAQAPQVMSLQALRGDAPVPALAVEQPLLGGAMVLVPFALVGEGEPLAKARAILEDRLLETGLADARTALMLNHALGADAEHARLMTLDDLAALSSMQWQNSGLDGAWQILERALFGAADSPWVESGCCLLRLNSDPAQEQSATQLAVRFRAIDPGAIEDLDTALQEFAAQTLIARQSLALLSAHALTLQVEFEGFGDVESHAAFWIDWFVPQSEPAEIRSFLHPALGVAVYGVLDSSELLLGLAYPSAPQAHRALKARFADQNIAWTEQSLA